MTLVMAYVILVTAAVAGAAALVDVLARPRGLAGRWVWVAALVAVVPVTAFVMTWPRPGAGTTPSSVLASPERPAVLPDTSLGPTSSLLSLLDRATTIGWILASATLLLAIGFGQWRVARAERRARRTVLQGHLVLLTEDLGPAVAGVARPVVFVPRWVAALDDASQRLLLAHELEHVRRRDTALLTGGALLAALLPWNPVVWWLAWRLRVAVELDCDRRVLVANPGVRRYADLLLLAAGKPRLSARLLAAHFGEHTSDLERRIEAMTNPRLKWRPMLASALIATGLTLAACEAPRPEPVAPIKTTTAPRVSDLSENPYFEYQVEVPVRQAPNSTPPRYPAILREAGVEGEVLVSFTVDEQGLADPATFKVLRTTHELFAKAVREALPAMRFVPAEVGGRKVKQIVQQPFSFAIARATDEVEPKTLFHKREATSGTPIAADARKESPVTAIIRRRDAATEAPNVMVFDSEGREVARYVGREIPVADIAPESIERMEVLYGKACSPLPCPLIRITLAKGRTLQPMVEPRKPR